ncbi:PAS domain-containing protein [Yoonia sp.]|uniref:PAS domain-containing protein n=1 Tax=Yoonia sp. TaxID=2212373 RepID=UPI003F6C428E
MKRIEDTPHHQPGTQPGADNPILTSLEHYWQTLRRARRLPLRNEIEPSQIDRALPHAFILQRVAPGVARMRVAGQHLHDLLQMDARGMPVSTFFESAAREQIAQLIESAFQEPAIIALPLQSPGGLLRPAMKGTMLLLPLNDEKGETTRVLGAIVTDGQTGNRPRRFYVPEGAVIRHETLCLHLASTQPVTPAMNHKGPGARRPALRLVVDNS